MVFRISIFLLFLSLSINTAFAESTIGSGELIERLKETGELGMFDAPTIGVFEASCSENVTLSSISTGMKTFCETVTSSEICKNVEKKDLLNCDQPEESKEFDTFDFLAGCTTGLFDGVKAILKFMWDVLKWVWDKGTHPKESYQEASEVTESVKLYLSTEYDKAYDKASPPFRRTKAAKATSGAIANMLFTAIQDFMYKEYQEFGCLNFKARTYAMCKVAAELLVPPAVALKLLKGRKMSWKMERAQLTGESSLGRSLTKKEIAAIKKADLTGKGMRSRLFETTKTLYPGPPNPPPIKKVQPIVTEYSGFGIFEPSQLNKKVEILKKAGFPKKEIMKLMEDGAVGVSAKEFAKLFGQSGKEIARKMRIRQDALKRRVEESLGRPSVVGEELDNILKSRLISKGTRVDRSKYDYFSENLPEIKAAIGKRGFLTEHLSDRSLNKLLRDGIVGKYSFANNAIKRSDEMFERVMASSSSSRTINITPAQMAALDRVHMMDIGKIGKNGGPARSGNHTLAQVKRRAKILEEAGFRAPFEARKLVEVVSSPHPFVVSKQYDKVFDQTKKILNRNISPYQMSLIEEANIMDIGKMWGFTPARIGNYSDSSLANQTRTLLARGGRVERLIDKSIPSPRGGFVPSEVKILRENQMIGIPPVSPFTQKMSGLIGYDRFAFSTKKVTIAEMDAIEKAYQVGKGIKKIDPNPTRVGTFFKKMLDTKKGHYTKAELITKRNILKEASFSRKEIKYIMEYLKDYTN